MFNEATSKQPYPRYLSSDNDPLFEYHRWKAHLRVLEIDEIKSVPYLPLSHPFVERLIGSVRRELLDQVFFWNSLDLQRKLDGFTEYFNSHRTHSGRDGLPPLEKVFRKSANLTHFSWLSLCRGLFQLPALA